MFPNLAKLAAIGLLWPMSTMDCERGFSTLSRVKTDLRNRLNNTTLNHLLMMSIEGPPHSDFPYDNLVIFGLAKEIEEYQFNYKHYNNLLIKLNSFLYNSLFRITETEYH